jgi:hypothetical protein
MYPHNIARLVGKRNRDSSDAACQENLLHAALGMHAIRSPALVYNKHTALPTALFYAKSPNFA